MTVKISFDISRISEELIAFINDLPTQLSIGCAGNRSGEACPLTDLSDHWRGRSKEQELCIPSSVTLTEREIAEKIAKGIDPYAVGSGDGISDNSDILDIVFHPAIFATWQFGKAVRDALPGEQDGLIEAITRICSRSAVIEINTSGKFGEDFEAVCSEEAIEQALQLLIDASLAAKGTGSSIRNRLRTIKHMQENPENRLTRAAHKRYGHRSEGSRWTERTDNFYGKDAALTTEVMAAVACGWSILCMTNDSVEVPAEIDALIALKVTILPMTSRDLLGLLRLTHSTTGEIATSIILERLPSDDQISKIPTSVLLAAFSMPTTITVADAIVAQAKLQKAKEAEQTEYGSKDEAKTNDFSPRPLTKLADLKGQPEAHAELLRIAVDVQEWSAGKLAWRDAETSVLFFGPPGIGKTMTAEALAGELSIPLIDASIGKCQSAGPLSDTLKAFNAAIDRAEKCAPSVLLMDELDSLTSRTEREQGSYMRLLVNAVLEALTRVQNIEGVVVIGTTNDPTSIDPAIIRSGRFDVKIAMKPPSLDSLCEIVKVGLADTLSAEAADHPEVYESLRGMAGLSGADAARVARRARGLARVRSRQTGTAPVVKGMDLREAVAALQLPLSVSDLHRIAVHEAGHVLVGVFLGMGYPASVALRSDGGIARWGHSPVQTEPDIYAEIITYTAGSAAERLIFGGISTGSGNGSESDFARATQMLLHLKRQHGFDAKALAWEPVRNLGEILSDNDRVFIDGQLALAERRASEMLFGHRESLEVLADVLLREREIEGTMIRRILEPMEKNILRSEDDSQYTAVGTQGEHHDTNVLLDPPDRRLTFALDARQAHHSLWSRLP